MNVLKCQHHVCFNDEPKLCLSVSSGDRQSIKGHHPKYNSYTNLLSVLMLLCCVVNCNPLEFTYRYFYCKLGADMVHSAYVYNVVYFLSM